jgi:hypothetical protein
MIICKSFYQPQQLNTNQRCFYYCQRESKHPSCTMMIRDFIHAYCAAGVVVFSLTGVNIYNIKGKRLEEAGAAVRVAVALAVAALTEECRKSEILLKEHETMDRDGFWSRTKSRRLLLLEEYIHYTYIQQSGARYRFSLVSRAQIFTGHFTLSLSLPPPNSKTRTLSRLSPTTKSTTSASIHQH